MSYTALARSWRPKNFENMVGQEFTTQALRNALSRNTIHHAYLFTGTRGVGKTTLARILAKCINCETGITATPCLTCSNCLDIEAGKCIDMHEIDAASRTKVEDTRDLLDKIHYVPSKGRKSIYIIDEVHMLSGHSFNALLKTLEEPPEHVQFILATTDPQKIPPTILSRCLQFQLQLIAEDKIAAHMQTILQQQNIPFQEHALTLLAKAAQGSMRDGLSVLDQCLAYSNNHITTENVQRMLGVVNEEVLHRIVDLILHNQANELLQLAAEIQQQGDNFQRILQNLLEYLHHCAKEYAIQKTVTKHPDLTAEHIQLFYDITLRGIQDLALAPQPYLGFEMTLLRLLAFTPIDRNTADNTTYNSPQQKQQTKQTKQTTQTSPLQAIHSSESAHTATPQQSQSNQAAILKQDSIKQPNTQELDNLANHEQWKHILNQIQITGATLVMIQQCTFKSISDNTIFLTIDNRKRHLVQNKYIQRLKTAISQFFNKKINISIDSNVTTSQNFTSDSVIEPNRQREQVQCASETATDETNKLIMDTFQAKLIDTK